MSTATDCLAVLREYRDQLHQLGEVAGKRWVERCIARLQRRIGDREDAITDLEIDSARMPLDGPVR